MLEETTSSTLCLDLDRVAVMCEEEWQCFLDDMELDPVPELQDLRGFFLNWVAVFLPEAFPPSLQSAMSVWMEPQLRCGTMWACVRPPLIGSTLFALTDESRWLEVQFRNFADGGSEVRSFFHRTLALVAPCMSFTPELVERLDLGLRRVYFFMDVPLALYAVSSGNAEEKLVNLATWQGYSMNPEEKTAIEGYLKGEAVSNPLQPWLLRMMTYVALRMGCSAATESTNLALSLSGGLPAIWERMRCHKLFAPYIRLPS
jgi:hypothetical protein